jgi:hypothetical protein
MCGEYDGWSFKRIPPKEASLQARRHFDLQVKCSSFPPVTPKTTTLVQYATRILGMEFQEKPSNGNRDTNTGWLTFWLAFGLEVELAV